MINLDDFGNCPICNEKFLNIDIHNIIKFDYDDCELFSIACPKHTVKICLEGSEIIEFKVSTDLYFFAYYIMKYSRKVYIKFNYNRILKFDSFIPTFQDNMTINVQNILKCFQQALNYYLRANQLKSFL